MDGQLDRGLGALKIAHPLPDRTDPVATLRSLAEAMQPGREGIGLSGLVQRAMDALGVDLMVVASRDAGGGTLEPLACVDRLAVPGTPDCLRQDFVRQALEGDAVIVSGDPSLPGRNNAFAGAADCLWYAALPLFDVHRGVLGVMVCASRRAGLPADALQFTLEIVASRFAAALELRAERERGRSRALLDGLTRLPNRELFNDRLESALCDARRTGEVFAVLFVDLDGFKGINDSLGHGVGDQVLVAQARRLQDSLRASDTVARYAGDEFTAILRHLRDRADVARAAAKLLDGMQAPLVLENGAELQVTASIGVSIFPDDAGDADGLVRRADTAMYSAKGQGRNSVSAFGSAPDGAHRQRLEMATRLREAEANGELRVRYQPQVEIASNAVVGVEALLHWKHPMSGLLGPAFFTPLAEETGLILPIGEWMLRRACADVAAWQDAAAAPLRLAVKLSALQWMQPNLVAVIEAACRTAGVAPGLLDLQATESVLAHPQAELAATFKGLRRIGCRIVIDDIGADALAADDATGLTIDAVKIDRCLVRNVGNDPEAEAAIAGMLAAARRQGRRVGAEGVETERQLAFLREGGCEVAQGGLFGRPMSATEFARLLGARRGPGLDAAAPARPARAMAGPVPGSGNVRAVAPGRRQKAAG